MKILKFTSKYEKKSFYGFKLSGHILVTGHSLVHWPYNIVVVQRRLQKC